ncbi:MAG TPA: ShlB/FhaC/HecB family hemolysin secretion/activation protein [Gallionella sp.]|jgi:hemolysin activation/secretion protein|nr:ShlB/FhaC/HecB family hemolysin secretion/activation protein [Gallionella sp.]
MTHKAKTFPLACLTATVALALTAGSALAQPTPDAGQLLQQERPAPALPKADPALQIAPPVSAATLPGGTSVALKGVRFTGNTLFSGEQLSTVLGDVTDKPYDLAGLQTLAQQISEHYRAAGYPFARAFIPEQKFADRMLQITIVEGHYGKVGTTGDSRLASAAQDFLADLAPGSVIESTNLERVTLILSDQPGIQVAPLVRPGQEAGSGDLVVDVSPAPAFTGELGLDNHGNRYIGEYRARANLQWDSPFLLGDQISVRGNASDEGQWLGNLGYSLPLGASGLRGNVGYAHTRYELAKQFANLDATGTADIASAGLSYPLIRSQQTNLYLAGSYQHKKLDDRQGATNSRSDKKSNVLPFSLQFDHRDGLGGGGITYGSLGYTTGELDLDAALRVADAASARTQGSFDKWNLDAARIQAMPVSNLTLFGRASAQWAGKNLDSSEDFGLGGPNGIRAYPVGEGFGDEGWLMQLEARYQMGSVAPYALYDAGYAKTNKNPWAVGNNERNLSGYGLGLRYTDPEWSVDAGLSWRNRGGLPSSDTADRNPRLWTSAGWRF